jgi:hypothetical protein
MDSLDRLLQSCNRTKAARRRKYGYGYGYGYVSETCTATAAAKATPSRRLGKHPSAVQETYKATATATASNAQTQPQSIQAPCKKLVQETYMHVGEYRPRV